MVLFLKRWVDWDIKLFFLNNSNKSLDYQSCKRDKKSEWDTCIYVKKGSPPIPLLKNLSFLFSFMGALALLGNLIVIVYETNRLIKTRFEGKEGKIYSILVLNLSLADLLMGVYMIIYSLEIKQGNRFNNVCNALGVISITSSQVSVTLLVIISAYRVYGIVFPYKPVHFKVTICLVLFCWATWIFIAGIPVFNNDFFSYGFVRGIQIRPTGNATFSERIKFSCLSSLFNVLEKNLTIFSDDFAKVVTGINRFKSNEVLLQVLKSFGVVDLTQSQWRYLGYFLPITLCTSDFLVNKNQTFKFYSLLLLFYNFLSFILISILCIIIIKHLPINNKFKKPYENLFFFSCLNHITNHNIKTLRNNENRKVICKLLLIIATDLFCWVPICLMGISYYIFSFSKSYCGSYSHDYVRGLSSIIMMILLPFNSVLNPFIYTFGIGKSLFKNIKKFINNHN